MIILPQVQCMIIHVYWWKVYPSHRNASVNVSTLRAVWEGFRFLTKSGILPFIVKSWPDLSTAYHVVTISVNIYVTFMWSIAYLRRKAVGNFNTCSLRTVKKNLKPDEMVHFIEFARFARTLAGVWIGPAWGWKGADWGRSIITATPGRWQCCTVCWER